MTPVLLDSCTWIWLASERGKSTAALEAISRARSDSAAHVSVISCWEVAKLVQKGKLAFRIPASDWIQRALSLEGIVLSPLTPSISIDSTTLPPGLDGDPADQILVATARQMGAVIVTPDRRIRGSPACSHHLVTVVPSRR